MCVQYLSEPFRASEIVGWFRRHYPDVKEQSLRAHVQGAHSNATTESRGPFATRQPLITRIDRGLYRRFDGNPAPVAQGLDLYAGRASPQRAHTVDIVLPEKGLGRGVGSVRATPLRLGRMAQPPLEVIWA